MQLRNKNTVAAARPSRGFTLVEVMISVALVLVLIIGVNQVFKITADTVSAGQVMSANIRDSRAAQAVVYSDVASAVQDPPMFIIAAARVSAFRNANDRAADRDYNSGGTPEQKEAQIRTVDLDNDNNEGETTVAGEVISPAIYNYRSHRIDRLGFFGRSLFQRQTADDGSYASDIRSSEAWIWYGHLRMANNSGTPVYFFPGQSSSATVINHNNAFGSQFALARVAILLRDPNTFAGEDHIRRVPAIPPPPGVVAPNPSLSPLAYNSPSTSGGSQEPGSTRGSSAVQNSRYDLAATTIAQFRTDLEAVVPGQPHWWQCFLYAASTSAAVSTPPPIDGFPFEYRFRANRYFTKPLNSQKAAELAPILLDGCSQFIVEFAGDYVTQAPDGSVTSTLPDNITDFVIDGLGTGADIRSVRWYGMPRDVAGSPTGGPDGMIQTTGDMVDVLPVRDVRGGTTTGAVFERNIETELKTKPTDYAAAGGMEPNARYTCVWGPDTNLATDPLPQMLRITYVLDDLNGRLAEGQQYEYVIDLPY